MKDQTIKLVAAGLALLVTVLAFTVNWSGCAKQDPVVSAAKDQKVFAPEQKIDINGITHSDVPVATGTGTAGNASYYQHKIDSMAALLAIKPKYIYQVIDAGIQTAGMIKPIFTDSLGNVKKLASRDSSCPELKNTRVTYNDEFLQIAGHFNDDSSWYYKITETLNLTTYWKKKGLFGRELHLDVSSTNPNTRITNLSGFNITPKPKKWAIGISANYSYNGTSWQPTIGIGLTRTLIRF